MCARVRADPYSCDIGYILHLLNNVYDLKDEKNCVRLVRIANEVRRSLAHYDPITLEQYRNLLETWREVKPALKR